MTDYNCKYCGEDTENNGKHQGLGDFVVCDYCAETYGCECSCFPPPNLAEDAWERNLVLEKVEQVRTKINVVNVPQHIGWVETEDPYRGRYEDPAFEPVIVPQKTLRLPYKETHEVWKILVT